MYDTLFRLSDPDANDAQEQQRFQQGLRNQLNRAVADVRLFRANIIRSKPPVPPDCKVVDSYYMRAVDREGQQTAIVLDALARGDAGTIQRVGSSGVGSIDQDLGNANLALERAFRGRGLDPQFRIETGKSSSMLGSLMGMGGL